MYSIASLIPLKTLICATLTRREKLYRANDFSRDVTDERSRREALIEFVLFALHIIRARKFVAEVNKRRKVCRRRRLLLLVSISSY
jgi:hypothetical protein